MSQFRVAQLNVARLLAPLDAPETADFVAGLDPINALADAAPGLIWRLQTDDGDATGVRFGADEMLIVNFSVWETIDALAEYAYRSEHRRYLARRREWFERNTEAHTVLWWIPRGSIPTLADAGKRLALLRSVGPTGQAFTFKTAVAPPDA